MSSSWDCSWGPDPLAEDVAQCETCGKWQCECCRTCKGERVYCDDCGSANRDLARKTCHRCGIELRACTDCDGTGRAKAVA